jgi:hypothetical protein
LRYTSTWEADLLSTSDGIELSQPSVGRHCAARGNEMARRNPYPRAAISLQTPGGFGSSLKREPCFSITETFDEPEQAVHC